MYFFGVACMPRRGGTGALEPVPMTREETNKNVKKAPARLNDISAT